jgi:hypothetical protein
VKVRIAALFTVLFAILLFFHFTSCRKINEATTLGQDLIPPIDNVHTFDTTLSVDVFNELFTLQNDTFRLGRSDEHFLGIISNDPLFGTTDARLFLQLKPAAFPYMFERTDSLALDSVVLVLDYTGTYGDTLADQTVNVYALDLGNDFRWDSLYNIRENTFSYSTLLASKTFKPRNLKDSVFAFLDTTSHQLRFRLPDAFGQMLMNFDTTNAYWSDSAFNTYFKGFALQSFSGNAVMGFNLSGNNTKLALYYSYPQKGGQGTRDTTVTYFRLSTRSASANYIIRNYSGSQLALYQGGTAPDDLVFLQNTPGSYARVQIPALATLSNRIIHRAELIIEQVYHPSDNIFGPPDRLFLDAYDTTLKKYRTIPFDFTLDFQGNINAQSFGMNPKSTVDGSGNPIKVWRFNISRYIQNMLTGKEPLYELRLISPYFIYDQYRPPGSTSTQPLGVYVNNSILRGRLRAGGGNHPTQPMRLRIIYSKI